MEASGLGIYGKDDIPECLRGCYMDAGGDITGGKAKKLYEAGKKL